MKRRNFISSAAILTAGGFFPRLLSAAEDPSIRLAHLGAHEGRFTAGALTIVSGYNPEGHHFAGQAVAQLISRHVSGAKAVLTVVASPAAALQLLKAARTETPYGVFTVDLAVVEDDELEAALHAAPASGPPGPGDLRLLALLPSQLLHVVTLRGSPIRGMGDVEGKTISLGSAQSRSEKVMLRLLETLDLRGETSVQREALPLAPSMKALAEKKIDAFAWHGPSSPALFERLSGLLGVEITLLSHEEAIAKVRAKHGPAYHRAVIGKATYPWLEKDVHVIATANLLVCRADLPAPLAYDIVKTLRAHPEAVAGGQPPLDEISARPGAPVPLPLHPGTLKLIREASRP